MNKKIVILTSLTHILKKLYKQCGTRTADDEIFENKKCLFYHLKIIKKCQILRKQFHFFDHFLPKSLSTVLVFVPNYLCDFFQCIRRDVRSVCVWGGGGGGGRVYLPYFGSRHSACPKNNFMYLILLIL